MLVVDGRPVTEPLPYPVVAVVVTGVFVYSASPQLARVRHRSRSHSALQPRITRLGRHFLWLAPSLDATGVSSPDSQIAQDPPKPGNIWLADKAPCARERLQMPKRRGGTLRVVGGGHGEWTRSQSGTHLETGRQVWQDWINCSAATKSKDRRAESLESLESGALGRAWSNED